MTQLATQLSTQPAPVGPDTGAKRTILQSAVRSWRLLTSMRTALLLLFLLAAAAIPGTLLPQRGLNPIRVTGFYVHHPKLAPVLSRLGLFDVFASAWFSAIYLLLFISLVGCVLPRLRAHFAALRAPLPRMPRHLNRLAASASWVTDESPRDALEASRSVLRGKRWRTQLRDDGLAAEAGRHRETGNLIFHSSLIALLLGIGLGSVFGYQGTVLVIEGNSFTNTVTSYDQYKPGRLVRPTSLKPFSFTLDEFRATYQPGGEAKTFDALLTYRSSLDGPKKTYDLRVNHPLRVGLSTLYLLGHGYAVHVVVKDKAGAVVFDDRVPCLPQDGVFTSICTIKVPDAKPQLGFLGFLFPSGAATVDGQVVSTHPALRNPVLTLRAFSGDLGLDSGIPQSVYSLDTTKMSSAGSSILTVLDSNQRQIKALPGGATLSVAGIDQWATFQIKRDPAKLLTLVAGVLMIIGLVGSLFIKRRRLWVRATPVDGRTLVEVGGLSRTDADGFTQSFTELVAGLKAVVPPRGDRQ